FNILYSFFFFSSRRRHTRFSRDWSSDVCSSDLVFATAKHFPGHGDTDKDSHHTLPTINRSLERMNEIELYPYKRLFKEGLASVRSEERRVGKECRSRWWRYQ